MRRPSDELIEAAAGAAALLCAAVGWVTITLGPLILTAGHGIAVWWMIVFGGVSSLTFTAAVRVGPPTTVPEQPTTLPMKLPTQHLVPPTGPQGDWFGTPKAHELMAYVDAAERSEPR